MFLLIAALTALGFILGAVLIGYAIWQYETEEV